MHGPEIQLHRLSEECQLLYHGVHTSDLSSFSVPQDSAGQPGEKASISDPEITAPTQVLLSRNGVGKTTIVNHELMLGQIEENVSSSHEKAPKRYQQTEHGKVLVPVSEAVAEVLDEDGLLCSTMGHVLFVCNPAPDADSDQQKQQDNQLTTLPIKKFVYDGPPEAHTQHRSFLLKTGCHAGTTTNSILRIQFGHIPGAIERFKSRQQLQSDAFEYAELKHSDNPDQQQLRKLYEQYKLITGLTAEDPLPHTAGQVSICKTVAEVAGKIRLYSGHSESTLSFRWFLRDKLSANKPLSPVHVALDSTTIYWPSSSVLVPIIDTPGTGDANILNEATTQAAVDDATLNASQLLICGTKSLDAEASLGPLVIQYMQFMITSTQSTPCIRGVLLPETSGQRYSHKTVCSDADLVQRQEKIAKSLDQLQRWMHQANEDLPEHQRGQPERLAALLERCEVKVVYMNLYASLCLQSHDDLSLLADQAGSEEKPVIVSELLEATGGPWLLGLSSQLAAQAVLPALEEMRDVHVEELLRILRSREDSREHSLSPGDRAALAKQSARLKKNDQLLQLRKDTMLPRIIGKMAGLKTEICQTFARLGQACKQDCIEQTGHIHEQWDKRLSSTTDANLSNSLARVQSVPKTAAYRHTFAHTGTLASMDDVLQAVEEDVAASLTSFATQHVFEEIVNSIVECLKAGLPEVEHAVLLQLIQRVAESCVMPSLAGLVNRFVKRLLKPGNLKASLRGMQANCTRTHLLRGPLASTNDEGIRRELLARVDSTLQAAQRDMPSVFHDHVHNQVQDFVGFLTKNGSRYKGGVERFTLTLVKEIPMHCRGVIVDDDAVEEISLYDKAVALKQAIQREINAMKDQAATSLTGDLGLAASLHKAAKFSAQLEQHPDLCFLLDRRISPPTSRPLVQEEQWLNLNIDWPKIAEQNLQGCLTKQSQEQLLWRHSLGLPSMSDSEWQQIAQNSLPAALQHLIWPPDSRVSLKAQMSERQRVWSGIRISIAHRLIGLWDDARVQSWLQRDMVSSGERTSPSLEQYMKRTLEPNGPLGFLELLAFMMSCVGVDANSSTQCIQLWLPAKNDPNGVVLFHPFSTDRTRNSGSRRTFVYNLLAVTLPKSRQVVWLTLEKQGHTEVTGQWEQRFNELDEQAVVAATVIATASDRPATTPVQSASMGLRARGQRQGCFDGPSRTTKAKRARQ